MHQALLHGLPASKLFDTFTSRNSNQNCSQILRSRPATHHISSISTSFPRSNGYGGCDTPRLVQIRGPDALRDRVRVRLLPREPLLPAAPRHAEAAGRCPLRCLSKISALLEGAALSQIPDLARPHAQAPRAAAAGWDEGRRRLAQGRLNTHRRRCHHSASPLPPAMPAFHALGGKHVSHQYRSRKCPPSRATTTTTHLVEARHGLVGRADLHLVESCIFALALLGRAWDLCLMRVVPRARPAEDVLLLLLLELAPLVQGLLDDELVGARPAFEPVPPRLRVHRYGEDVCALRADWTGVVTQQRELGSVHTGAFRVGGR